jgi:hypothetical protein
MEAAEHGPLFKWETMKEVGPHTLGYRDPVPGKIIEAELAGGQIVRGFRADDGKMYFCHGLTFGGTEAPGGPVSPFSGRDVRVILGSHYRPVHPETAAEAGDILVWRGLDDDTPHSAILVVPVVAPGKSQLDYSSQVRTKNGRLPEEVMSLERLTGDEFGYGDSFDVFRRHR